MIRSCVVIVDWMVAPDGVSPGEEIECGQLAVGTLEGSNTPVCQKHAEYWQRLDALRVQLIAEPAL